MTVRSNSVIDFHSLVGLFNPWTHGPSVSDVFHSPISHVLALFGIVLYLRLLLDIHVYLTERGQYTE